MISSEGGSVEYGGELLGFRKAEEDEEEPVSYELSGGDPFAAVARLFSEEGWCALYGRFLIDGETRYYMFRPSQRSLDLDMLANRKVLADGTVDFNWHYAYWKPRIARMLEIEAVTFTDVF
ncbi:MAG: hypothetical protein QM755_24490 [Luteolibacter sp.]